MCSESYSSCGNDHNYEAVETLSLEKSHRSMRFLWAMNKPLKFSYLNRTTAKHEGNQCLASKTI